MLYHGKLIEMKFIYNFLPAHHSPRTKKISSNLYPPPAFNYHFMLLIFIPLWQIFFFMTTSRHKRWTFQIKIIHNLIDPKPKPRQNKLPHNKHNNMTILGRTDAILRCRCRLACLVESIRNGSAVLNSNQSNVVTNAAGWRGLGRVKWLLAY